MLQGYGIQQHTLNLIVQIIEARPVVFRQVAEDFCQHTVMLPGLHPEKGLRPEFALFGRST